MQPPQNPYGNTPNPAPQIPNSPRGGQVSLDALSDAWAALTPTLLTWIGAGLLCFLLALIYGSIQRLVIGGPPQTGRFVMPSPTPASVVLQLVSSALSLFVVAAVFNMALHQLRTGRAEISQIFGIGDVLPALMVAGVLNSILQGIGWIFVQILLAIGVVLPPALILPIVAVPALLASIGLMMVTPLIVDQKVSGIEAISRSWQTMSQHLGAGLLVIIVLFLVNVVGACLCGLGLLVTVPLSFLTVAFIYRDLFLGGTMGPGFGQPSGPNIPPPIASPR